jgi:hypothetical protein
MDQPEIHGSSVVSWSDDAVATDVNDEVVLMNMERNRCYGLGSTGSEIWRKLGNPIRVSELIAQIVEEYDGPPGKIETDVLSTLAELHCEGLLRIHSDARRK